MQSGSRRAFWWQPVDAGKGPAHKPSEDTDAFCQSVAATVVQQQHSASNHSGALGTLQFKELNAATVTKPPTGQSCFIVNFFLAPWNSSSSTCPGRKGEERGAEGEEGGGQGGRAG